MSRATGWARPSGRPDSSPTTGARSPSYVFLALVSLLTPGGRHRRPSRGPSTTSTAYPGTAEVWKNHLTLLLAKNRGRRVGPAPVDQRERAPAVLPAGLGRRHRLHHDALPAPAGATSARSSGACRSCSAGRSATCSIASATATSSTSSTPTPRTPGSSSASCTSRWASTTTGPRSTSPTSPSASASASWRSTCSRASVARPGPVRASRRRSRASRPSAGRTASPRRRRAAEPPRRPRRAACGAAPTRRPRAPRSLPPLRRRLPLVLRPAPLGVPLRHGGRRAVGAAHRRERRRDRRPRPRDAPRGRRGGAAPARGRRRATSGTTCTSAPIRRR